MEKTFFNNVTSNYEMFFTPAGSCQMDGIVSLYNYIMTYLTSILCIVTTALLFIIVIHLHGERHLKQFKNEEDLTELLNWMKYLQRWTHSTILELVWTIIPTLILIAIAIPSFILLYSLDEIVDTQSVVKIIAYQWYWKYEYPVMDILNDDVITFSYLSYMLPFDDLTEEKNRRLLEVDAPLVLPTNVNSKLIITAKDVLHSFAIPALGIKMDAVPGRLNQITVHIFKSGMFYGQCSELCGVNHGFMPIVLAAVDFNTFEHFLTECSGIEAQTPPPAPAAAPQPTPTPDEPDNQDEKDLFDEPDFDAEANFDRILKSSDNTGFFPEGSRREWLLYILIIVTQYANGNIPDITEYFTSGLPDIDDYVETETNKDNTEIKNSESSNKTSN